MTPEEQLRSLLFDLADDAAKEQSLCLEYSRIKHEVGTIASKNNRRMTEIWQIVGSKCLPFTFTTGDFTLVIDRLPDGAMHYTRMPNHYAVAKQLSEGTATNDR